MTASERKFLGMLTPSSNTILEPVTSAMLAGTPDITGHFGRFRVTEISLGERALGQFDSEPMLAAAELLADAHAHSICWNGTSAGWLGFDRDEVLCAAITERTGVPACSSVLAINEIFQRTGVKRFGLVSPYLDNVQEKIISNYAASGWECAAEEHLKLSVNFSFSEVSQDQISAMIRKVAESKPDAIVVFCTNLIGGPVVEALEAEIGIPIYDTVQTAVWSSMRVAGADPARIKGWGSLFSALS
ncbi:maleate cis-trans isomerase family protein [Roseibium algae]|uniref:Aspartate/glutamate racemase family protein n=1 Tax=Roseibium algae TaxID=3123038 RepID=A0ABU8TI35_9HYPH